MPPVEDLENPNYKFATEVFSDDGKVLGTYSYSKENRVYVGYQDLSPHVINALIATEDVRFSEHSGIDAKALFRAVVKRGILMQKNAGGGSTITQQLSKQLYSPSADNVMERLFQKPIEWVIAVKLERYYTKEEILTMYLNKFDFLNNAVGIKTAAFTYFGCEPKDLKKEEAATKVKTPANGNIKFEGLDAGTYYLEETDAPEGYNTLTAPIEVIIDRTLPKDSAEAAIFSGQAIKYGQTKDTTGTDHLVPVENNRGTTLPSTGGVQQSCHKEAEKGTSFKNDKRINIIHSEPPALTEL